MYSQQIGNSDITHLYNLSLPCSCKFSFVAKSDKQMTIENIKKTLENYLSYHEANERCLEWDEKFYQRFKILPSQASEEEKKTEEYKNLKNWTEIRETCFAKMSLIRQETAISLLFTNAAQF